MTLLAKPTGVWCKSHQKAPNLLRRLQREGSNWILTHQTPIELPDLSWSEPSDLNNPKSALARRGSA